MLHSFKNTRKNLDLPSYESLKQYEGKGNYAIGKYYKTPFSFFYRKKLKMIIGMLNEVYYDRILDFGSGPGILDKELDKYSLNIIKHEKDDKFIYKEKFDLIICSSVLEFVELEGTLLTLKSFLKKDGILVVASPKQNILTKLYFKLIGNKLSRNSHKDIIREVSRQFKIQKHKNWMSLYFCIKAKHE